jgi:hypothetical protein
MEAGAPAPVAQKNIPAMPVAWILATVAAIIFVLIAFLPENPEDSLSVLPEEYTELRNFTIFFIAALLPSDAAIRFGRGILFRTIGNAKETADQAPRATLPQILAFVMFLIFAVVTVVDDKLITHDEYKNIYDVAKYLIVSLLPSEAIVRVGRALFLRNSATVSTELAKKI